MFGPSRVPIEGEGAKVLTTKSPSPTEVPVRNGQAIEVLDRGSTHKWLGCMLCTANTGNHALDLAHHLHAASKAFFANTQHLVKRNVAMQDRFRYFSAIVTPVACFGAAHKMLYKQNLCKMDIVFRRLLRSIVRPLGDVDWTLPWQSNFSSLERTSELSHSSSRIENVVCRMLGTILEICELCDYVSNLPGERWVVRALNWFPESARRVRRPAYTSDSMIGQFLQAQSAGELATTCPGHFLLDEPVARTTRAQPKVVHSNSSMGHAKNGGKGWKIFHVALIWKTVAQNYWISDLQTTYIIICMYQI